MLNNQKVRDVIDTISLDSVQLVLTEPGQKSALRRAIDDSHALPPVIFQTSDAFFSLARAGTDELTVLSPFLDQQGADFLVELFALSLRGRASEPDMSSAE
jgi:hypothetical protein